MVKPVIFLLALTMLLVLPLTQAIQTGNPYSYNLEPQKFIFSGNITNNISVNSSQFWDTLDQGSLRNVSQIEHNRLLNLGWLQSGHFINTFVDYNGFDLINATNINTTNIWATFGNFTDLNVSNGTLFVGNQKLSSNLSEILVTRLRGEEIIAFEFSGDGHRITNLTLNNTLNNSLAIVNQVIVNDNITSPEYFGGNYTGDNFTGTNAFFDFFTGGTFSGIFNFFGVSPWLSSNGTHMEFNETFLRNQTEVISRESFTQITTVAGIGSAITIETLKFQITQIEVISPSGGKFRFEASETGTGDIIDADLVNHFDDWLIEKSFAINDTVTLNISDVQNDGVFNVTLKYLNNWDLP